MTDGAHLNMNPDESLKAVLGGEEPNHVPDPLTDEEFEKMIRTAPMSGDGFDYDTCSEVCARLVLEAYEKYPVLQTLPMESRYLTFADGKSDFDNFYAIDTTIYDVMRKLYDDNSNEYKLIFSSLSGFMWGWAVNAARNILGLGPVPNPALITIELKTETSDV